MGDQEFQQLLLRAIIAVERYKELLPQNLDAIHACQYRRKFPFEPFPNSSTTYGKNTVRLANNWESWGPIILGQAANLVHESEHQLQHAKYPGVLFFLRYAVPTRRYEMERDAFFSQLRFMKAAGMIGLIFQDSTQVAIREITNQLVSDYLIPKISYQKVHAEITNFVKSI